jgi:hypothetical protein
MASRVSINDAGGRLLHHRPSVIKVGVVEAFAHTAMAAIAAMAAIGT